MSDKRLVDVYYEDFPRWVGLISERLDILWAERYLEESSGFWEKEYARLFNKHFKQHDKVVALVAQTDRLLHENGDLSKENALLRKENAGLENDNKGLRFRVAFLESNEETLRTKIENLED